MEEQIKRQVEVTHEGNFSETTLNAAAAVREELFSVGGNRICLSFERAIVLFQFGDSDRCVWEN